MRIISLNRGFTVGLVLLLSLVFAVPEAMAQGGRGGRGGGGGLVQVKIDSNAFPDGGIVPPKYVSRGDNVQPDFRWSNLSGGAVSVAIILHDLDVALGGNTGDVLHWVAWNIPASAGGIPEGSLPAGSVQGSNITGQQAYMGPGAPAGERYHHYTFEFYFLNSNLDLPPTASRDELLAAMQGKVVAKAAYIGRYHGE
jgi:Raf kinase inhibitor-like YbhB/YbcL family protein